MKYVETAIELHREKPISTGVSIASRLQIHEQDPRKAAALCRARERMAQKLRDFPELSLAALRLGKGLSQSKLAEIMDVKQPYIARIERGEDDLHISTVESLAKALGVPPVEVFAAIAATRAGRETTNE
jgi:ribosome-binding protein aMBF1 (putative translation factor)